MENTYLNYLDKHKKSGYILGIFSLPNGIPAYFIGTTIVIAILIQSFLPLYHIPFFVALIICWDLRIVLEIRNRVLEKCITEESFLSMCLEMEGGDPYFPEDPPYIVESDRIFIFEDALGEQLRLTFFQRLKDHYIYLISVVALYLGGYFLLEFILQCFAS